MRCRRVWDQCPGCVLLPPAQLSVETRQNWLNESAAEPPPDHSSIMQLHIEIIVEIWNFFFLKGRCHTKRRMVWHRLFRFFGQKHLESVLLRNNGILNYLLIGNMVSRKKEGTYRRGSWVCEYDVIDPSLSTLLQQTWKCVSTKHQRRRPLEVLTIFFVANISSIELPDIGSFDRFWSLSKNWSIRWDLTLQPLAP